MASFPKPYIRNHEKLFIHRYRLNLNQTRMAGYLGLTRHRLSKLELGELKIPPKTFGISDIKLTKVEICIILRRRLGLNHTQLSGKMGVSRTWVSHMETGRSNPARLIEYWSS